MPAGSNLKVALVGNPNSGKSSLFNHLTGLNQKVGNFPGVTVEKKTGKCKLSDGRIAEITDLPGTYSIYPKSADEQIVFDYLFDKKSKDYPDLLVIVVDSSNLKRNLFLFSQLYDLGIPCLLVLTMTDVASKQGVSVNSELLSDLLNVPVLEVNARTGKNLFRLKHYFINPPEAAGKFILDANAIAPCVTDALKYEFKLRNSYEALQVAHQYKHLSSLSKDQQVRIEQVLVREGFNSRAMQISETMNRYAVVDSYVKQVTSGDSIETFSDRLDKILTHRVWGYVIFFAILFSLFQAIFSWASVPMDLIDSGIAHFNEYLKKSLPDGPFTNLLTEGIISGLGGILIFLPQIAILFAFIAILEESGYMARVMFIMDKFMRKFGMNGKSVVPLISGLACAVPAVMASRSIENWKERMITIFVTPFMSCSARIPVYTILIALVIPPANYLGLVNLQGLVLMGMYLLGFLAAIFTGIVMQFILEVKGPKSFFILELPSYKVPRWKNVGITIVEKVQSFVFEAGKVILAISVILWVLASYGPGDKIEEAHNSAILESKLNDYSEEETNSRIASLTLENSYAGHFGKLIEPVISPLGFDWKIGVALITSFAAREVFVGTMATIYSIGADAEATTVKERMKKELSASGQKFYNLPLGLSLLVFYAFAMQCMSTIAIVHRETKGWKWPLIQFFTMTALAYFSSFLVYNLFS